MVLEKQKTDLKPFIDIYNSILKFKDPDKNEFRLEQVQYAVMCFEGVQHKKDVIIEGPTGLGKTRALISAVLPKLLEDPETRIVYATRTASQTTHIMAELKEILEGDEKFSDIDASVYTGIGNIKSKVCDSTTIKEDYPKVKEREICPKECPLKNRKSDNISRGGLDKLVNDLNITKDPSDKSDPIDLRILDQEELLNLTNQALKNDKDNQDTIKENNKRPYPLKKSKLNLKSTCCPISAMRSKGKDSRILVCTSQYLFDDKWIEDIIGKEDKKSRTILIMDEAHNFLESVSNEPYISLNFDKEIAKGMGGSPGERMNSYFPLHRLAQKIKIDWINEEDMPTLLKVEEFAEILKDELKNFEIEENKSGDFNYIISEENMLELIEAVNNKIDLEDLHESLKDIKERMECDWGLKLDYVQVIQASSCLHSSLMIIDYLKNIKNRPYDFASVFNSEKVDFYTLHPRNKAEKALRGFRNIIFTSATLSPVKDIAYLLSLDDYLGAEIDPVFGKNDEHKPINEKKYLSFFIAGVNSSVKKDDKDDKLIFTVKEKRTLDDLFLSALDAAKHKNIGIFCNSNKTLVGVYKQLENLKSKLGLKILTYAKSEHNKDLTKEIEKINDDYKGLCKIVKMGKETKNRNPENITKVFKKMGKEEYTTVLLATAGGTLAEGTDYPDDNMEMVITIGLPYPSSATETKINDLKSDYFLFQKGDKEYGKDLAYKQIAFRKLAQSIGRANRKKSDRAVVICADERLMAIKNVKNEGHDRYEYLNTYNAKNNLKIIQERVRKIDGNLVFSGHDKNEEAILKNYISSGFCKKKDFIEFKDMNKKIKEFYND